MIKVKKTINFEDDIFKTNNLHKIEFLGVLEKYLKNKSDEKDENLFIDDYREKYLFFKMKNDIYVILEKYDFLQTTSIGKPVKKTTDLELKSSILTKNLFYDIFSDSCKKVSLDNKTNIFAFIPEEKTFVTYNGLNGSEFNLDPIIIKTDDDFVTSYSSSVMLPFTTVFSTKNKLINNINIYPFIKDFLTNKEKENSR